jgi:lactate permease
MPNDLPIDLLHWSAALLPIVVLLVLLAGLRWKAPEAGPVGMFLAAGIALFLFQAPLEMLAVAAGKGVWDAVFILYVIWPALLLYKVADQAGAFEALRVGITRFSKSDLFLVLAFGWVFASFLQGIAGFGVPIAVVAPLLIGLGVKPIYAVVIPLIGHVWANMFGTLAVGWLATEQVITMENPTETAFQTALMLIVPNALAGGVIAWLFGRMKAVIHALPMIAIIVAIHGGVQAAVVLFNPVLSAFLASTVALVALYPLSRWSRYGERADQIEHRHVMASQERRKDEGPEPTMGLGMAFMPYAVLTIVTLLIFVPAPVEEFLEQFEIGPSFPAVEGGFGQEVEAEEPFSPFAPLAHPGTPLLIAAIVAFVIFRMRGFYAAWAERHAGTQSGLRGIVDGVIENALPASVAVLAFLVMSNLMSDSGQTDVLAVGISEVAPAPVYAFIANFIGVIGAFMTSSNTASNILFAPLQQEAAAALEIQEATIIGAQSTGGAIGNAIAPANVVLGTGTAGIVGKEGDVLRFTLPYAGAAAILVGVITLLLMNIELVP